MKFRVKDEDGRDYVVEELEEEKVIPPETVEDDEDETLSAEEIKALRELLGVAPRLMDLLKDEHQEHAEDEEVEEDEEKEEEYREDEDEDEIIEDDDDEIEEKEEILETKSRDSKKAYGSIEKSKKTFVDDSLTDNVSDAWAKRYNGGKV